VTRGVAGAKQGTLAFFVGGSDADFERVKPALEAMGDTFHRMGIVGNGHATKLLTNALSYGTVALVNEMLLVGKAFGLDLADLQPALISGAGSKALEAFGPRIIAREYAPARVTIGNVRAHLETALTLAPPDKAPLNVLGAAKDLYEKAGAKGQDANDMAAIAELWPADK
jgi:2-hydroxy-3-oxopropionate reductase